jgi:hypothetical protein
VENEYRQYEHEIEMMIDEHIDEDDGVIMIEYIEIYIIQSMYDHTDGVLDMHDDD